MSAEFLTHEQFYEAFHAGRTDFSDITVAGTVGLKLNGEHAALRFDRARLDELVIVGWNNPVATLSAEHLQAKEVRFQYFGIHQLNLHGASIEKTVRISNSRIKRLLLSYGTFAQGFALYKTRGELLNIEGCKVPRCQYDSLAFRDINAEGMKLNQIAS